MIIINKLIFENIKYKEKNNELLKENDELKTKIFDNDKDKEQKNERRDYLYYDDQLRKIIKELNFYKNKCVDLENKENLRKEVILIIFFF